MQDNLPGKRIEPWKVKCKDILVGKWCVMRANLDAVSIGCVLDLSGD